MYASLYLERKESPIFRHSVNLANLKSSQFADGAIIADFCYSQKGEAVINFLPTKKAACCGNFDETTAYRCFVSKLIFGIQGTKKAGPLIEVRLPVIYRKAN